MEKARPVSLKEIRIRDNFWDKYRRLVREEILKYQWCAMNDQIEGAPKSHCIENFRIAAGEKQGEFYGAVFQDSDVAKWLEAVAYTLAEKPDKELKKLADSVIELIGRAQEPDGYFNTYFILKEPGQRFRNLREGHELYTLGHMIEAAVAYKRATGEKRFLEIVQKMADLVANTFGVEEGKRMGMPGHQEIELALMKLYEETGKESYKELAKYFIDVRGCGNRNYFLEEMKQKDVKRIFPELNDYRPEYSQSHLPVRKQRTAEGHAVRAVYMYAAMADIAAEYDDEELLGACETLWNNMVHRRMYVTGGIGLSGILERFTADYDLPNDYNYCESCASIGLAFFARRMMQITKKAKYVEVMERALYNTVLAGIAMDGKSFFYVNPLEVWPPSCMERTSKEHVKSVRQKWFGVACCPANISRTLASLGEYIYACEKDTIYVNLFIGNETQITVGEQKVHLSLETDFPWKNQFKINVSGVKESVQLAVRIPEYAQDYKIFCEGREQFYKEKDGYAYITCEKNGRYEVQFVSEPRFVRANPKVRADEGKVCVMWGPLVYTVEETDNGENLQALYIDTAKPVKKSEKEEFPMLIAAGKRICESGWGEEELYGSHPLEFAETEITLVPYAYWGNRENGEMAVWLKEYLSDRNNK